MDFTIRRCKLEDAGAIARVHVDSWRSTYAEILSATFLASLSTEARTESWQRQIMAGTSVIFVAERQGGVVGFAAGGKSRQAITGYDAELYAIYLLREEQVRGIGRALVNALVDSPGVRRDAGPRPGEESRSVFLCSSGCSRGWATIDRYRGHGSGRADLRMAQPRWLLLRRGEFELGAVYSLTLDTQSAETFPTPGRSKDMEVVE